MCTVKLNRLEKLVLIPAFNEERNIASVIQACLSFAAVVVIDDGSTDKTAEVAQRSGAKVLPGISNEGYEAAICRGLKYFVESGYSACVFVDADGEIAPHSANGCLQQLSANKPLILGRRPSAARFGERVINAYYSKRHGIEIDACCGCKAIHLSLLHGLALEDCVQQSFTNIVSLVSADQIGVFDIQGKPRTDKPRFGGTLIGNYRLLRGFLKRFL